MKYRGEIYPEYPMRELCSIICAMEFHASLMVRGGLVVCN